MASSNISIIVALKIESTDCLATPATHPNTLLTDEFGAFVASAHVKII